MTKHLFSISILISILMLQGCISSQPLSKQKDESSSELPSQTAPLDSPSSNFEAQPSNTEQHSAAESSGLTPEILYDLLVANLGYQRQENELATSALTHAANLSRDPALLAQAARTALHYQQYQSAAELGQLWVSVSPEENASYIVHALAEIKLGNNNKAFEILSSLIAQRPTSLKIVYQQINSVIQQHAASVESMQLVKQLVQLKPQLQTPWLMQAALAETLKDESSLAQAVDALLKIDASDETAAIYKIAALEKNAPEQLTTFAQAFFAANPEAMAVRLQYARTLLRLNREQDALLQYQAILSIEPENSDALYAAGLVHHGRAEFAKAAGFLRGLVETEPDNERARFYLGTALRELKRYDESIAILERINSSEQRFGAQRQIAINIEQKAGVDAALDYLQAIHPADNDESVQLLVDKQRMLRRAKRYERAKELLDAGLAGFPNRIELIYNRALLAADTKDLVQHEADMRHLIELEPDNANYYNTLGYTLIELSNQYDEARVLIEKAMLLKPDDPYITDSLGWLEFKAGALDKAATILEKAFELDSDAEIAAHLGEVYWALGQKDKARDIWQAGQKINPQNKALIETLKRFTQ